MSYPTSDPTAKHDLVGPWPISADGLPAHPASLRDADSIFSALSARLAMTGDDARRWARDRGMRTVSNVCTYPDAPREPKPLSRVLEIVGFADLTVDLVRKVRSVPCPLGPAAPMSQCAIAVRRADGPHRRSLESDPRKLKNSEKFAHFVSTLRRAGMAAVIGTDSCGRFGLLLPVECEDGGYGKQGHRTKGASKAEATESRAEMRVRAKADASAAAPTSTPEDVFMRALFLSVERLTASMLLALSFGEE